MKIIENEDFLIVDTENDNKPFCRVYVFLKNDNCVKTFGLFEIEDNLYSPFDDIDKKISMFCVDKGII